ncbi:hypothetical protein HOU66_gp17 [Pectobacterium phage Arno160]|uniref:Uncharacterized protein n=1 Tax=Pectobacterium phage Arno160 TaxID=2488835 RepID=A0A3G8F2D6_9CAUD|nr:hypothetical protein HOU66_gp17 [Pectobacterium phage Arno160]AZF88079.1 hypothetical protein Arno160_gp17 [Pectobacterium phage Arno160]
MTNVTLKVGMQIIHNGASSSRQGSRGIVMATPNVPGVGEPKYVVCWYTGGRLQEGQTAMALYTSDWLPRNCVVAACPVENDYSPPVTRYLEHSKRQELYSAANAVSSGPYMVGLEGKGMPSKEHASLTCAKLEAERLSKMQPGKVATVLAVVAKVKQKTVTSHETVWLKE